MAIDVGKIDEIIRILGNVYPGWDNFAFPPFVDDEVNYKRTTVAKARELLSEEELRRLLDAGDVDQFIKRLERIGQDNNLLWQQVPLAGDLNILYDPHLEKSAFCQAVFDLLYGPGPAHERLTRYTEFVKRNGLPNKWTFPTYFLFVCHPESEMFVKPMTTKWFVQFVGGPATFTSVPTPMTYVTVKQIARDLLDGLAAVGARDMIDIQSVMWVCSGFVRGGGLLSNARRVEFTALYAEFVDQYARAPQGTLHLGLYEKGRESGRQNYDAIVAAADKGEDITDQVLLKLLPYTESAANRAAGAWVHVAPAVTGDVRRWFENAGWTTAADWPRVAAAILGFLRRSVDDPEELRAACNDFSAQGHTKGFQTGMLTPILNALRPDDYLLVNNKSRRVINHFASTSFSQKLIDYPPTNDAGQELLREVSDIIGQAAIPEATDGDVFDMFCHWLVAVKKHSFRAADYWKIAPGENAWNWDACREGGFIALGWDEIGDISGLTRSEFNARRDDQTSRHEDWTKSGANQLWEFAHIREGDRIVANRGTNEVLGIGTVVGSYVFVPGVRHGHRLPVEWDDLARRRIAQPSWQRTLVRLDQAKFESILAVPPIGNDQAAPMCPFTPGTFDLLSRLHQDATIAFYQTHRDEFETLLEKPFQGLVREVAARLPDFMRDRMETEDRVFARIAKNDYGRGGAWDFYWAAFYPKGGKRTRDAQLFMAIYRDRVEYGFSIGDYGSDSRPRFVRNWREHQLALLSLLHETVPSDVTDFGERRATELPAGGAAASPGLTLDEWWESLDKSGIRAVGVISKETVLQSSTDELCTLIVQAFQALFPLVLLASSEDPMPEIDEYVSGRLVTDVMNPAYALEQLAADTYLDLPRIRQWVRAVERKKQAVIYGPPGTGKTFVAERMARHLVAGDNGFMDTVQFHPAYTYEDFIQGLRPQRSVEGGIDFRLVQGRFLEFCAKAATRTGTCVLIVDEINRANLSRVFGELMYLLEYRDREVPLAGGGHLKIPANVRLIGTMNTADRSIALVDHALRRRFAFLALYPEYEVLRRYHETTGYPVGGLVGVLKRMNHRIDDPHYGVGVSFFLREELADEIQDIWRMEIEPYLEEYFFDQHDAASEFAWDRVRDEINHE